MPLGWSYTRLGFFVLPVCTVVPLFSSLRPGSSFLQSSGTRRSAPGFDSFSFPVSRSRVENASSWQRSESVPCSIFYRRSYCSSARIFGSHLVFLPVAFLLLLGFWSPCRFPVCVPARWPDWVATRRYHFLDQAVVSRLGFSCSSTVVKILFFSLKKNLVQCCSFISRADLVAADPNSISICFSSSILPLAITASRIPVFVSVLCLLYELKLRFFFVCLFLPTVFRLVKILAGGRQSCS
jgi:hypothetical protein